MLLLLSARCEKTEGFLEDLIDLLGFSQFLFQFSDAALVFRERNCLMAAADESVITVTDSGLAPFGKRVVLETELICCSFYSDLIGEL